MVATQKLTGQGYGEFDELLVFVGDTQEVFMQPYSKTDRVGSSPYGTAMLVQDPLCNSLLSMLFFGFRWKRWSKERRKQIPTNFAINSWVALVGH